MPSRHGILRASAPLTMPSVAHLINCVLPALSSPALCKCTFYFYPHFNGLHYKIVTECFNYTLHRLNVKGEVFCKRSNTQNKLCCSARHHTNSTLRCLHKSFHIKPRSRSVKNPSADVFQGAGMEDFYGRQLYSIHLFYFT